MKLFDSLRAQVAALLHRSGLNGKMNGEMEEELRSHMAHRADDLERSGVARAEAERQARVEFGGYERYRQESHEAAGGSLVESLLQDLRFALRVLRKSPGFAAVAVVTLALAIGANTVVFSVMNGLILRPLDLPQAQSLSMVERVFGKENSPQQSYPDYLDLRNRVPSFDGLIAYEIAPASLKSTGTAHSLWLYEASGNYFDVLGVKPYLGRFFHASDEHGFNSAPYIVLSYAYWQSHFNSDAGVVGRVVQLNKFPYTILGVAPPKFRGTELFYAPALWAPMVNQQQIEGWNSLDSRNNRGMWLVGRLRGGANAAQVGGELSAVAAFLSKTYPKEDDRIRFVLARPGLIGDMRGPVRDFLGALMLLAGLILLAACANLGSLFAARAADRSREVALRLALGSSRMRIVRQLLTEAIVVSLMGGVLGVLVSVVLLRGLSSLQPVPNMPINVVVDPDVRTYVVALLLALASGLLFGIVPVRQVFKADPYQVIKAGATGAAGTRRWSLRDLLLAGQVAVCAVLVTASLVAVRGLVRSLHCNFGFQPQGAIQVSTDLDMAGYSGDKVPVMQRRMLDAVSAIPGVTAAGYADRVPLNLNQGNSIVFADSTTDYRSSNAIADSMQYNVSPEYFEAAATAVLSGRTFKWQDDKNAPRVAVVNQEFARKVFGSVPKAIGNSFKVGAGTRVQVIGVVEDGRYKTLAEEQRPAMFFPMLQWASSSTVLVVRSNRDSGEVTQALDRTLHNIDAGLPFTINTWTKALDTALFAPRAATAALGVLGCLGAMLAATGIFGMAAYSVSKRLRELGIRIALGAQRKQVLGAALGRALRLLALGSVVGLVLGMAAGRVLALIVYQATPRDPLVLGGVVLAMLLLGLLATWIPAQRALSVDPLKLLREE